MSQTERKAIWIILGFLLAMVLAGCTTERIEVDRQTVAAHELVDFMWCTPQDGALCVPMINQGGQFILLEPGMSVGTGGDIWDTRPVDAAERSE